MAKEDRSGRLSAFLIRVGAPARGRARKAVPTFASEAVERAYWERANSGAGLDWRRAERKRLPNLMPSTTATSLRLPISLLKQIKIAAHKRDVTYQSLIKMWLRARRWGGGRGHVAPSACSNPLEFVILAIASQKVREIGRWPHIRSPKR